MVRSRPLEAPDPRGHYELIHGVEVDGAAPVHDFLQALGDPDFSDFYSRFEKLVGGGILLLPVWQQMGQWFKPLRNVRNVWQIAATSHRLLGFRDGSRLVLTNGFYKAGGKTPPDEIERSLVLQRRFKAGT